MANPPRFDREGVIFHVTSRGIGARTIFETEEDRRYFLALVIRAVHRGDFDLLAFTILHTHFHLIIRSRGRMSEALQRIKSAYARYFNRSRGGRTGTAFDRKFFSKPVHDVHYEYTALTYVDDNAIKAGLAARPEEWRWGSAWYVASGRRPSWLDTTWILARVPDYARRPLAPAKQRLARDISLERWLKSSKAVEFPLHLFMRRSKHAMAWMVERAVNADGGKPGGPLMTPTSCASTYEDLVHERPPPQVKDASNRIRNVSRPGLAFLLRELCGAGLVEIGLRLGGSRSAGRRALSLHSLLVQESEPYRAWLAEITRQCLARVWGEMPHGCEPWGAG